MWIRGKLLGLEVVDCDGAIVGRVVGTHPFDGSDPEFIIVSTGRFAIRRPIPLNGARAQSDRLQVPYTRWDIDDAPALEDGRYEDEQVDAARGYWDLTHVEYDRVFERIARARRD